MKIGFIGTGSMGSILIESLIETGAFLPSQICIVNRTRSKALKLAEQFVGIHVAESIDELARLCHAIFICVRPTDYRSVLDALSTCVTHDQSVISITSSVRISDLERWVKGKVIKCIPSITNAAHSGAMLVIFGNRLNEEEQNRWLKIFSYISQPIEIDEKFVRVSSDLTSCGPAFFSLLLEKFIQAAVDETGISHDSATYLATHMFIGLGQLLASGKFNLMSLREKVCVPGGVTGAGLAVIENEVGQMFHHIFQRTHEKFENDLRESIEVLA